MGGRGYSTKFYTGRLRAKVQSRNLLYTSLYDRKGSRPFRIPSINKLYQFHRPSFFAIASLFTGSRSTSAYAAIPQTALSSKACTCMYVGMPRGVLPYITYTGMCPPTGSWFWSSWFRTGYAFQRRFLERGIIFNRMGNRNHGLIFCLKLLLIMKKHLFDV